MIELKTALQKNLPFLAHKRKFNQDSDGMSSKNQRVEEEFDPTATCDLIILGLSFKVKLVCRELHYFKIFPTDKMSMKYYMEIVLAAVLFAKVLGLQGEAYELERFLEAVPVFIVLSQNHTIVKLLTF